jgi:hypothetical protein
VKRTTRQVAKRITTIIGPLTVDDMTLTPAARFRA